LAEETTRVLETGISVISDCQGAFSALLCVLVYILVLVCIKAALYVTT